MYDLIVVGMGPAGVTAAIYAKAAGLKVLCFDKGMIGGTLNYIDKIENYPGLYGIKGPEFAFNLYDTVKKMEIEFINKGVDKIEVIDSIKNVYVGDKLYQAKNIIIAIGRTMRKLGLDRENEFLGKGLSRCALCDGNFFKEKDVCVVGGGNSALQEALYLANICNKVYLVHRRDKFRAMNELIEKVKNKDNIEIIYKVNVTELLGDNLLTGIKLDNGQELEVNGLFIYVGFVTDTEFIDSLNITDEDGYIIVDSNQETNVDGIYAIGDVVKKDVYQISNAVGEGTMAATKIISKIIE